MITTNAILVLIHFRNQQGEKTVIYLPNEGSKHRQLCLLFLGRKISLLSCAETQG